MSRPALRHLLPLLLLAAAAGAAPPAASEASWSDDLAAWKRWRLERLRQPDSWLTLVGLAWLQPGDNPVGSDPQSRVLLPRSAPPRVGVLRVEGDRITFVADPGALVQSSGVPISTLVLRSDADGEPTLLQLGSIRFYVIRRADRLAVRIKDSEAESLKKFPGLEYYPADPKWRVEARFEPALPVVEIEVPNVLGFSEKTPAPGHVSFDLGGIHHRLLALDDTGDGRLFLVFGDQTNGRETYGGGRFLYAGPPVDGRVTIDFNRAYNPPCVFSPYATCPLPPPGNRLPIRIEAGEKKYALATHS